MRWLLDGDPPLIGRSCGIWPERWNTKESATSSKSATGMAMKLSFVKPRRELQPYIESFWVLESPTGLPAADKSMAVPSGCPKLIIPYENSLVSIVEGRLQVSRESVYFVGNRDSSAWIRSSSRRTGVMGIEFCPHGAFPVFRIPMQETVNQLFESEALFGSWGRELQETLCNMDNAGKRLDFIQNRLVTLLHKNGGDNGLIDFCVRVASELVERTRSHRRNWRAPFQPMSTPIQSAEIKARRLASCKLFLFFHHAMDFFHPLLFFC